MQTINLAQLKLEPRHKVLDLGCGEGRHAHAVSLLSQAQAIALDINLDDVKKVKQKLAPFATDSQYARCHSTVADGAKMPFPNATFDRVICSEVLEHIHKYADILEEIERVLKPGGLLAVSVPRSWPEHICWWLSKEYHQVAGGHIRIFNARKLKNTIASNGFSCIKKHWAHALHTPYWWLRCLFWQQGERFTPVAIYHRLLVWDLLKKPRLTRYLEWLLNPLLGKSVVMYFIKTSA